MGSFLQDLRYGFRILVKSPGLAALAVIALGLGIGLTTMMFSIVMGVVFTGLPFEKADRLMHLETNILSRNWTSREVPLHDYLDWKAQQQSFEGLAAFHDGTVNLSGTEKPERFEGAFMTANSFDLLRARPLLGRTFQAGEDAPGAELVVLLGHSIWRDRYASDPQIVGRSIRVNASDATVIGVMPEGFQFPIRQQVWVPMQQDPVKLKRGEGDTLEVYGRLRDGVTYDAAQLEFSAIAKRLELEHSETNEGVGAVVKPYTEEYIGDRIKTLLYTMLGAVGLVLLIACANVTNLLLARTSLRAKEIAVRTAIGASRRQVVTQLLTESFALALLGGLLGVLLAWVGVRAFNLSIADVEAPYWIDIGIHGGILLFTLAVTVFTSLIAGIVPAIQASRADVNTLLKDESRGSSSFRLGRLSKALVIGEVAFSCALLVLAGLMIRTVVNVRTIDLGFQPEGLLTARVGLFETAFPEKRDQAAFFEQTLERLKSQPGVLEAAVTTSLPTTGSWGMDYQLEGKDYPRDEYPQTRYAVVSPDFFAVLGATAREGRLFDTSDNAGALQVAVVNRSFAAKVWPGESPVGKRVRTGGRETTDPWRTVVGVVPDLQMNEMDDPEEADGFYVPLAQDPQRFMSLMVRAHGPALALTPMVRDVVAQVDKDTPIYFVRSMDEVVAREQFFVNLFGTLFTLFGGVALLLASVGMYGVMSFSVNRRTQEIGVRMALGAQKSQVLRLILRQGSVQLALGLVFGLALAWGGSKLLKNFLVGVEPHDLATFLAIAFVLSVVGMLACLLPARRATRVDPMVALRYE